MSVVVKASRSPIAARLLAQRGCERGQVVVAGSAGGDAREGRFRRRAGRPGTGAGPPRLESIGLNRRRHAREDVRRGRHGDARPGSVLISSRPARCRVISAFANRQAADTEAGLELAFGGQDVAGLQNTD